MIGPAERVPAPARQQRGSGDACRHPPILDPSPHDWQAHVDRVIELRHADPEGCVRFATVALQAAEEHGAQAARMQMSYFLGFALHLLGRNDEAFRANDVTLKCARLLGDVGWEGRALMGLGTVFSAIGDHASAIDHYEQSLALRRAVGDRAGEAAVFTNLGEVYRLIGFEARAVELYGRARDLLRAEGRPAAVMVTNAALAELDRYRRLAETDPGTAVEAAEAAYRTALDAVRDADACDERRMAVGARLILAEAELALGLPADARGHVEDARVLLVRYADPQLQTNYLVTLAGLLRAEGRPHEAITVLREALARCEEKDHPRDRQKVLADLERSQEAVGDLAGALQTLRELHRSMMRTRDVEAERRAHVVQARMDVERARHAAEVERLRATRLEQQNRTLSRLAQEDDLTGLPNRRALEALLKERLEGDGDDDGGFVFALGDLDHFKRVNDRYSHQTGDDVLRQLGKLMTHGLRADDVAARYGGEEFAIIVDGSDPVVAAEVCERLRRHVQEHPWAQVHPELTMTISIGATAARPGDTTASLLARADAALYSAKTKGRNRVELG